MTTEKVQDHFELSDWLQPDEEKLATYTDEELNQIGAVMFERVEDRKLKIAAITAIAKIIRDSDG